MAPLLDLGFSSFQSAEAMYAREINNNLNTKWMCSWELISFLDKFSFVCDAIMYRMYCAEYDIPCDYSNEECEELAAKYKDQIYMFQSELLSDFVNKINKYWIDLVKSGDIQPKLPPTAKTALMNFIAIANRMAESELAPHFISLFASLSEAHKERTSNTMDISDVQETITKDQFLSYCNTFNNIFMKLFQSKDGALDQKLFNTRIGMVKKVLMTILWMCEPNSPSRTYAADQIFDKWIYPYMDTTRVFKEILSKYSVRKSVPMAYALCVTPETVDLIPEDTDSYPITDSFRFMSTLLFENQPLQPENQ